MIDNSKKFTIFTKK